MPDLYQRDSAAAMLERLAAAEPPTKYRVTSDDPRSGAVLGETFYTTRSTNPGWYQEWIAAGFEGPEIRAALMALRDGCAPNLKRREARAVVALIDGARRGGDPGAWLDPQRGRADGMGGGPAGHVQARIAVDGASVRRVTLRVPETTLTTLRAAARARGITLNAFLLAAVERVAASEDLPAHGALPTTPEDLDTTPF